MASVKIADLKNNLSAYLRKVRTGEEVIICDRKSPIAKIVPLGTSDLDLEEQELIAKGLMLPPQKPFDADAFFAIGRDIRRRPENSFARMLSRCGWSTSLEVRSVLNRVRREGTISSAAVRASWERASRLLSACIMIPPTDAVKELAYAQLDRFPLKASDALQLAAALVWCKQNPRGRWFVCNDRQLLTAAVASGFEVLSV
jgi:prevent-host-death family protein